VAWLAATSASLALVAAAAGATAVQASDPSAIGDMAVFWIVVSPSYAQSGLVVAVAAPASGCTSNCTQLWVTRDGGATWGRSAASGWRGGRPVIGVDRSGHEVLFAGANVLQRSDDDGASWTDIGSNGGTPAISPTYAQDGTVAVANGKQDYLLSAAGQKSIPGSGGALSDVSFAMSTAYPAAGSHSPALLSAADPKSGNPVIQRCTAAFSCSGSAPLPGAGSLSEPVSLLLSTAFAEDGVVFAQAGRGIYKSVDGGGSFAPIPVGAQGATATATPQMALGPGYRESNPSRPVFVAVLSIFSSGTSSHSSGGVLRSEDGGASWSPVGSPSPLDGGATAVAVAPDGRLFGGYLSSQGTSSGGGLLCSSDGQTWHAACSPVGTHQFIPPQGSPQPGGGQTSATSSCAGSSCTTSAQRSGQSSSSSATAQSGGSSSSTSATSSAQASGSGTLPALGTGAPNPPSAGSGGGRTALIAAGIAAVVALAAGLAWTRRRAASADRAP
jgi:hypothetical protein